MTDERTPPPTPEPVTEGHGPLATHSARQLLTDLREHLEWARTHLNAYRVLHPESPLGYVLLDIKRNLDESLAWMAFGDLDEEAGHDH